MQTDTALLKACNSFLAELEADHAACDDNAMHVKSADAIAQTVANLARISAMPATSIAGLRAKARIIRCLDCDNPDLVSSLCTDLENIQA